MSLSHVSDLGERNALQGKFGETWVRAAAAACGIEQGPGVDSLKGDVRLTRKGLWNGTRDPSVQVQVKTTINLGDQGSHWAYGLDVVTYEKLRLEDHQTRYVLVVIGLSESGDTLQLNPDGTVLLGHTSWVSLEGREASTNSSTQTVYLPKTQTLDPDGLHQILNVYGVPRSSQVPEVDEWEATP